jgi:hypothetical protein
LVASRIGTWEVSGLAAVVGGARRRRSLSRGPIPPPTVRYWACPKLIVTPVYSPLCPKLTSKGVLIRGTVGAVCQGVRPCIIIG